jgi:hypothetical protein
MTTNRRLLYAGRRGLSRNRALPHEQFWGHGLRQGGPDRAEDAEYHLLEAAKLYHEWLGSAQGFRSFSISSERILSPRNKAPIDIPWLDRADREVSGESRLK